MSTLVWIILGGVLMSLIALVGAVTLVLPEAALSRLLRPLVVYIGASDLVPEVNKGHTLEHGAVHFATFVAGLALLYALAWHH